MSEKAILFDSSRCTACRGCQVACKCWNGLPSTLEKNGNPSTGSYQSPMDLNGDTRLLISFHEEAGGDKGVKWAFGRRSCQHCTDAPCATICPGGALKKDEATGFVSVDESKCIGCGACRKICAHDAPTIENRKMHIDTNKCVGCGRCIAVCPMDAIEGVYDPNGHLLNCKMAEYAKAVVQGRPSFHISLAMDISPNCDCHAENDVPVIPNVGMFASFDPVALDEACAEMCSRMPRNPNAAFEDASSDDLFHAVHTVTHWQDQTEHGEKIGLGSREYKLIEI